MNNATTIFPWIKVLQPSPSSLSTHRSQNTIYQDEPNEIIQLSSKFSKEPSMPLIIPPIRSRSNPAHIRQPSKILQKTPNIKLKPNKENIEIVLKRIKRSLNISKISSAENDIKVVHKVVFDKAEKWIKKICIKRVNALESTRDQNFSTVTHPNISISINDMKSKFFKRTQTNQHIQIWLPAP